MKISNYTRNATQSSEFIKRGKDMRQKLKELRLHYGHTQDQVAVKTGTTKEYYGLIENGRRVGTLPYWLRLQKVYKLSDEKLWSIAKEGVSSEGNNTTRK